MTNLQTNWMNGIQFYLRREVPIAHSQVGYIDSPWALSSVSQAQFWSRDFASTYGDGQARDCLSALIAEWDQPGILYGKPARERQTSARMHPQPDRPRGLGTDGAAPQQARPDAGAH